MLVGPISDAEKLISSNNFSIMVCRRLAPIFSTFWLISVASSAILFMPRSSNTNSTFSTNNYNWLFFICFKNFHLQTFYISINFIFIYHIMDKLLNATICSGMKITTQCKVAKMTCAWAGQSIPRMRPRARCITWMRPWASARVGPWITRCLSDQ